MRSATGFETTIRELSASQDQAKKHREIPFNYTSADDRRVVTLLLGPAIADALEQLRGRRVTGRSARLLMRIFGEILIHRRNPFLFQELLDSPPRRRRLAGNARRDLATHRGQGRQGEPGPGSGCGLPGPAGRLPGRRAGDPGPSQAHQARAWRHRGTAEHPVRSLALVSHATDATDWRLHLPLAVVWPDRETQVAPLLAAIGRMGLKAIHAGPGRGSPEAPYRSGRTAIVRRSTRRGSTAFAASRRGSSTSRMAGPRRRR